MATFNYVEKDGNLLDKKITAGLFTGNLGTPEVDLVNGGRSFTLRSISTSGLKPHTRGKGFNEGTVEDSKTVYTMGQDRDVEFYIDKQDVDETDQELAMANISKTFIDEKVVPEVDSYRFSRMANYLNDENLAIDGDTKKKLQVEEDLTKANVYSQLKAGVAKVRKYNPANLIGYVSSAVMDALEMSTEFNRSITNQNVGTTALDSRITSLDGVTLVEVWDDSRFKSKFDFTGEMKVADDAQDINFEIVAKQAVIPIVKENAVYLFAPGEHTQGDGYLYQNRLYHDFFIKKSMVDGIFTSLATKKV